MIRVEWDMKQEAFYISVIKKARRVEDIEKTLRDMLREITTELEDIEKVQ
jgi:uncharacterized protein (DUF2132 family)